MSRLEAYQTFWNRGLECWSNMEARGFHIDPAACERAATRANTAAREHLTKLDDWYLSTHPVPNQLINWSSSQQLSSFLYDYKNLPIPKVIGSRKAIKLNRGKKLSTSQASLEWHVKETNVPQLQWLLDYRAATADCTRVSKLPTYADSNQRIHSVMAPTTDTGRAASKNPALQQIPSADRDMFNIRRCFTAPRKRRLVVADYSQLELYVLAHYLIKWFDDDRLAQALQSEDVHSSIARLAWPHLKKYTGSLKQYDKSIQKYRSDVKSVIYGIMYGKTAPGLGASIMDEQGKPIGRAKAQELIDVIFTNTGIGAYQSRVIDFAIRRGYIGTLGNRRRPIPEAQSEDKWERLSGERKALNSPIQGGAADIVTQAMINAEDAGLFLVMQIHDELIVECDEADADKAQKLLTTAMTASMFDLRVGLKVDSHIVTNWGDAK